MCAELTQIYDPARDVLVKHMSEPGDKFAGQFDTLSRTAGDWAVLRRQVDCLDLRVEVACR